MPAIGASTTAGSTASAPSFSGGSAVVVGFRVLVTPPRVGGDLRPPGTPAGGAVLAAPTDVSRRVAVLNCSAGVLAAAQALSSRGGGRRGRPRRRPGRC